MTNGDHIELVKTVNHLLDWDVAQCRVSQGERILVLVLDDLLIGKSPLYRLAERWPATSVAVLIGVGRQPSDFSDDS